MRPSFWISVLIAALFVAAPSLVSSAPRYGAEAKRLSAVCTSGDKTNIAATKRQLEKRIQSVVASYQKKAWDDHDKRTQDLLYIASQVPVQCIATLHGSILATVKKQGVEPLASFVIDYGARLALIRTKLQAQQFAQIRSQVRASKWKYEGKWIYLRDETGQTFRGTSPEIGKAIALLVFSDFGRDELLPIARTPGTLIRLLGAVQSCRESSSSRAKAKSTLARVDTCDELLVALRTRMPASTGGGGDFGGLMADMSGIANSGFGITDACMKGLSNDPMREQAGKLETYMQCRTAEKQRKSGGSSSVVQKLADGYVGGETFQKDPHGSKWEIRSGSGTSTVEHTEGHPEPGVFEDYYSSKETDSKGNVVYESNEKVTTDLNTGQVTSYSMVHTNDPNTGTSTTTEGTSIAGVGGVSTTTTTDAQGNTTSSTSTTIEYDDGSTTTTTTTVDPNGKVTTTETSTPPTTSDDDDGAAAVTGDPGDEYMASSCTQLLYGGDPRKSVPPTKSLGPVINPNPDAPVGDSLLGACIPKGGNSRQKCTSLMLCVEGQVSASSCNCSGTPQPAGNLPGARAGTCAATMCAEGASCDVNTGMCSRSTSLGGGFEPPVGGLPFPPVSAQKPSLGPSVPRSRLDAGMQQGIQNIQTIRRGVANCDPNTQIAPCR